MNISLASETIFHIGSFPVTNAFLNSAMALVFFTGLAFCVRGKASLVPGRLQNALEMLLEWLMPYFDRITKSREKTLSFLPLVGTLFLFILFSNWVSLLPGTGSIGIWETVHGEMEFIPLFRPAMSDLNSTLALAALVVVTSHLFGMYHIGFFAYLGKYIKIGGLIRAVPKGIVAVLVAFVDVGVGFIEIVGEFAKIMSLSLRLFGNVFAGEVLLTVIGSLLAIGAPIPFMGLEVLVGLIQASIFAVLTVVYFTMATTSHDHAAHS